ncbi:MAG: tRNA (adenosine(37)-N6)-dimethylallyltransferase MiaA [Victivallaceae bacterium]
MDRTVKIVVVTGPTATGKTALSVKLAEHFSGEIISADSRQVYRGMDIGTGKDLAEYCSHGKNIPYHLIDVANPDEEYNLMEFCCDFWRTVQDIDQAGRLPLLCGGTALYIDAVLSGYELQGAPPNQKMRDELRDKTAGELAALLERNNPEAFAELKDCNNKTRLLRAFEKNSDNSRFKLPALKLEPLVLGVYYPRTDVHRRIEQRLDQRLENGMIEEIAQLHAQGVSWERLEFLGLEYRYVAQFLQGKMNQREMRELLLIRIRQFAKRQDIWFRKMEREGRVIHWIQAGKTPDPFQLVDDFLHDRQLPEPEIRLKNIDYGKKNN